jgi:hypothetical protein
MSNPCLPPIISLMAAAAVLPLALCQSPPGTAKGDEFNSTTNSDCQQVYNQTSQKINGLELQIQAQSRKDNAACKSNQDCVHKVQQRRISQEQALHNQLENAKAQLKVCESKARLLRSAEPGETSPSPAKAKLPPFQLGIEENVVPDKPYNPGYPAPAPIPQPKLKAGAQSTQGRRSPKEYKGEVPGYGNITVDAGFFAPGQIIHVSINRGTNVNIKTAWGYEDSGKFLITKIEDLKGNLIEFKIPVALPKVE